MRSTWRDLPLRALTVVVGFPLAGFIVFAGPPWAFAAVLALLGVAAAWEYLHLVVPGGGSVGLRASVLAVTAAVPLLAGVVGSMGWYRVPLLILGAATVIPVCSTLLRGRDGAEKDRSRTFGSVLLGPAYCGVLPAHLVLVQQEAGAPWVALALVVTWGGDIGGYLGGRAFGTHLLAPALSPRKTVEGLIGSVVLALLLSVSLRWAAFPPSPVVPFLLVSLMGNLVGQMGDLWESGVKRGAGTRDSGRLVPHGGGALDVIDGLSLASPVVYWGSLWLLQ